MDDPLRKTIKEILDDLEEIEGVEVSDYDVNHEMIDIKIRGRLKKDIGRKKKQDPAADFDRAMKGLQWNTKSPISNSRS